MFIGSKTQFISRKTKFIAKKICLSPILSICRAICVTIQKCVNHIHGCNMILQVCAPYAQGKWCQDFYNIFPSQIYTKQFQSMDKYCKQKFVKLHVTKLLHKIFCTSVIWNCIADLHETQGNLCPHFSNEMELCHMAKFGIIQDCRWCPYIGSSLDELILQQCINYCKCWYFRGINFSRLAAQKHVRGLLNSCSGDAHLSFLYCTKLKSFNEWYNYKYVCNWAA